MNKNLVSLFRKRNVIVIFSLILIMIVVVGLFIAMQPQRTVANFCQTAKEEKPNFQANTNYSVLLGAFQRIDAVAPDAIRPDTSMIVSDYQSIVADPSKASMSELGMANSQLKVSNYIVKNCPSY